MRRRLWARYAWRWYSRVCRNIRGGYVCPQKISLPGECRSWLGPTVDVLNDQGMMGDGVIDIKSLRRAVEAQGFSGYSEIEIFSNAWWQKPIDEVLRICAERHRSAV